MRDTLTPDRPIKVELSASPARVSSKAAVSIGVVINELISNAVKNAFPDTRNGTVRVAIATGADGSLEEVVVEDDGIGYSPAVDATTGLSGKIVQALSHSLNASMSVETPNPGAARPGTRVRLIIREMERPPEAA